MSVPTTTVLPLDSRPDPFDSWATGLMVKDDLSQKSAEKYRALWKAWRGWLLLRSHAWHAVTGLLIEEFLQGAAPGQGGRRKAINSEHMSSYTRQRYWRLLRGVYATAVRDGSLRTSPVLDVPEALRPMISNRDRQSQVLEPSLFKCLRDPQSVRSIIQVKTSADWWHLRDRAILALLVDTGMTTSELIALRGMDLKRTDWQPVIPQPAERAGQKPARLLLDVMAGPDSVGRTLMVSEAITTIMIEWLSQRQTLLLERAVRSTPPEQQAEFLTTHGSRGPLFVARRARAADSVLPAMEAVTVYYTVSQALKKFRQKFQQNAVASSAGLDVNEPYVAKGPAVIRNSVIRQWLDTVGPEETVRLAGLKNVESLRLKVNSKNQLS